MDTFSGLSMKLPWNRDSELKCVCSSFGEMFFGSAEVFGGDKNFWTIRLPYFDMAKGPI